MKEHLRSTIPVQVLGWTAPMTRAYRIGRAIWPASRVSRMNREGCTLVSVSRARRIRCSQVLNFKWRSIKLDRHMAGWAAVVRFFLAASTVAAVITGTELSATDSEDMFRKDYIRYDFLIIFSISNKSREFREFSFREGP